MCEAITNGCGGRLALGSVVLIHLIIYNESPGPTVVLATAFASIYGFISASCKSSLRPLQMPYIRASNKFDFTCLFLATWMDILPILAACGALARTLSACLDELMGGLARILILGRNSSENEPWPDVLGVAVVFLVTGMFMLGLENTRAFSFIMTLGMLGINGILSIVGWYSGNSKEWDGEELLPNGSSNFLTAAALITFAYPSEFTSKSRYQRFSGFFFVTFVCGSILLSAGCLSTIVHTKTTNEFIAVPLFKILEENGFQKLIQAAACLLLLTCSGSFLELFPEMYSIIVRFAKSEWKILSRQISYESSDSGNPVLAVFIAGSLCAMVAFACPLQHLTYTLAAGHLCAGLFRAFYLLYSPFRPKYVQQNSDSSLSYSRLSTAPIVKTSTARRRSLWNINFPIQGNLKKTKTKSNKNKREVEKEWLLLGEPSSPCPVRDNPDMESTILSDGEPPPSDFEYAEKFESSESDTSTDIDAIVDEYRQKIKVTTAGPMERSIRVPSLASWRVTIFAIIVIIFGISLTIVGVFTHLFPMFVTGIIGISIVSIMMSFIPKYTASVINVSPVMCTTSFAIGSLLLASCLEYSWPAILIWGLAGLVLLFRCDNWCCYCFDGETMKEELIPSVSGKTTIRMPRGQVISGSR